MTIWSLERGGALCAILGDVETAKRCRETVAEMRKIVPPHNNSKQAAALLSLVGMMDAGQAYSTVLSVGGAKNFSTFYGYYMLEAMASAGKYKEAMDIISEYWGGMLDLGATTFWEDFDIGWLKNAARIDALVPAGKVDVHAAYGDYCYVGHRHSFCHGWASGPTVWLSEHVLGLKAIEPGGKVFRLQPHLGDLSFAEGTFPTASGVIWVKHTKDKTGKVITTVRAPKGIRILR